MSCGLECAPWPPSLLHSSSSSSSSSSSLLPGAHGEALGEEDEEETEGEGKEEGCAAEGCRARRMRRRVSRRRSRRSMFWERLVGILSFVGAERESPHEGINTGKYL
jgi:hypothetical protein